MTAILTDYVKRHTTIDGPDGRYVSGELDRVSTSIHQLNSAVAALSGASGSGLPGGSLGQVQTNGGSGTFVGITNAALTALLNPFTSSLSGVVPPSGGGSVNFLRADGIWAAPGGVVASISNSDGTLTISPTIGAAVASLNLAHANTWSANQTFSNILFSLASGNGIVDTSSILSNGSRFWSALIHRFARVFIGAAATTDGSNVPQSPTVLSSTYSFAWTQNSQLGVMSSMGLNAITGLSRASDWVTFNGSASQGSEGVIGFGFNDDTTTAGGSIAVGGNFIGVAVASSKGITLGTQNDINSARTSVTIDPYSGFPAGTAIATLATSGAYSSAATQNASAAYVVNIGYGGGPVFNTGLVFMSGSLATPAAFGGSLSAAIALPANYAVVWYTSGGTIGGSIYVDGSGVLNLNSSAGLLKFNGTAVTIP